MKTTFKRSQRSGPRGIKIAPLGRASQCEAGWRGQQAVGLSTRLPRTYLIDSLLFATDPPSSDILRERKVRSSR
jgi:hypothetical protein